LIASRATGALSRRASVSSATTAAAALLREHPDQIESVARRLQDAERLLDSVIGGNSMGRQLPDGAPIRIQLCRREFYEPGEIVAFWNGRQVTVHRVLFCGRTGRLRNIVITRGDAYLFPDLPFDVSSVWGIVIGVQTERGWHPPDEPPRLSLASRALARIGLAIATALCRVDLALARRSLAMAYFAFYAAAGPLGRRTP